MDVKTPESLFFMDLPDLRELCAVKIYLNPGTLNPCIRDAQIQLCRHLLFLYEQIVASPNPEQFDQITIIMAISFYRTGKVQSVAEKYTNKGQISYQNQESRMRLTCASVYQMAKFVFVYMLKKFGFHLLSMKMGQIVSIGHNISLETPFKSYNDFQIHWNMLYGYELPNVSEDKVIYCNVYFKLIGEKLFTYPFFCLRSQPIQFYPRADMARITNAFIGDLKLKMSYLCGFPIRISKNPLYTVMALTRPQSQGKTNLVNLTAKLPSGSLSQDSRYNAATSQKILPVKQTKETCVLEKKHPEKSTLSTLQMEPLISPFQPFQVSHSSVRHERPVQRYVPVFHRKNEANSGHFQLTTQDKRMFSSCITHSLKEHNSNSLTVSSVMVLSKPTQPSFSQIIDASANLSVKKLTNPSMIMKNHIREINRTMNATQHQNSIAVGKHQLCSASYQREVKPRPVSNPKSAEPSQLHTNASCEINCIKQIAGNAHTNQNAGNVNPSNVECLTREVSVQEKSFDFSSKRCRTKQTIKEVDVLKHAKNNKLHTLNKATLQNLLKQHGISTKARSKKEQLVANLMQILQEI